MILLHPQAGNGALSCGEDRPTAVTEQRFTARELLALYPNLTDDHLRYLRKWGLIRPATKAGSLQSYAFSDLAVARQVSAALAEGRSFNRIVRGLLADSAGQLALDFQADSSPAKVIRLPPRPVAVSSTEQSSAESTPARDRRAEQIFLAASALDDGNADTLDDVAARYREALRLDPSLVPALINLGNVHYTRGALIEAQVLYERAISLSPTYFEAHFNLGNVLLDLGRLEDACMSYSDAITISPRCGEAHFYLAVTLEKLGRSADARQHWRAYLELAPDGEWVDLAMEFSE
jgi:tetratricopeptide (TPR) repeat protein